MSACCAHEFASLQVVHGGEVATEPGLSPGSSALLSQAEGRQHALHRDICRGAGEAVGRWHAGER